MTNENYDKFDDTNNLDNNRENSNNESFTQKIYDDEDFKNKTYESYKNYSDYDNQSSYVGDKDSNDEYDILRKKERMKNREEKLRSMIREEVNRKKSHPILTFLFSVLGSVLAVILLLVFGPKYMPGIFPQAMNETQSVSPTGQEVLNISPSEEKNTESLVYEKASKSVVGVTTVIPGESNPFFQMPSGQGVGSGVIMSEDGYILTNSHVISDGMAQDVKVVFKDKNKEPMPAKVLWFDKDMDLAVLKIDAHGLTPISLGDSSKITVGDKAIAIGNPLGLDLQSTLTSGYISGLDRTIKVQNGQMDGLIQTDAAINSGNSGGALLNNRGELIGINTAKAGGAEGLGFAIPINEANAIVKKIQSGSNFEPVVMGIKSVTTDYYKGVTGRDPGVDKGIIVVEVVKNSPAEACGLRQNDIIVSIDDTEISSMGKLRSKLLSYDLGDKAKLKVIRDGKEMEIEITFSGQLN